MKLYVDDIRAPYDEDWEVARHYDHAIFWLEESGVEIEELSLDHDLGLNSRFDGSKIVDWMAEHNVWPKKIYLHTANPVGRETMARTIERYAPPGTLQPGQPYRTQALRVRGGLNVGSGRAFSPA